MLAALVGAYLLASLLIGLYAATRVKGAGDYAVARRAFGAPVVAAAFFATWFGAETVLGIPATFLKEGMRGLAADPFAAFACLVLVGLAFARPFFRMDALTLGDYFRARYGRGAEVALTLCIAFSYIGWIAAQLVALGLALNVISSGLVSTHTGILIGAAVVLAYTMAGGMWSVALTDFFQAAMIVAGLGYVAWIVVGLAGGPARVLEAAGSERMRFLPEADLKSVLAWVSAALVVMLGSVPQQDVLQRVMSARTEGIAVRATILGGAIYFVIALLPIVLVCAALAIDNAMVQRLVGEDYQLILPTLILDRTPLVVQALFFGALVSAILSTASGALLAPAVALAENVLRPLAKPRDDRGVLMLMRASVALLAVGVTIMALTSKLSIYQLVNESGKIVLVTSFVPLAAGIFWRRATARGAHAAIAAGFVAWILMEWLAPEAAIPPPLAGFLASIAGMIAGSAASARRARPAS
ncbi:MAG TPA: sodium:solute symporter family protein [Usitatibacter sp.]|nr:sodium:solute symporter family protein [Usitatibacter sp.]